jgi:phosphatidylglycerol lysyltransferase
MLQDYAFHWGENYASYVVTERDWETLWCRDGRGVVRFVRWAGRYALVTSALLAKPEDQETLLVDFMRFARANQLNVSFYNIGRDQLDLFRRHKFQVTKFGEEPVVRLDRTTWQGKDYEWIRRQENFCKRQGVELVEINPDPGDPVYRDQIAPELEDISEEHIGSTLHGREMRYFVGRFSATDFGHKRLFAARRDGRIEAFVVCNPCLSGTMWAVEMYRRRAEATRGVIPFAMLQIMRRLKEEGIVYCSLSLIPTLRCETALKGDSWIVRPTAVFWWHHLNWIFDFRGIYHFKSRFRPEYREMYVAAWPRVTVLSLLAVGLTWGLLRFNPLRLLRHGRHKSTKSGSRKSLAVPGRRPRRILRRLNRPQDRNGQAQEPGSNNGKAGQAEFHQAEAVKAK